MTWIKFTFSLLCIDTIYYAVLILWDYLRTGRGETGNEKHELIFVEDIEPVQVRAEEVNGNGKGSPVAFSGGVSLKELFNLAREESVEYIKAVSF